MIDYPRLSSSIGLGLAAVLCLVLAWSNIWPIDRPGLTLIRVLLVGAGLWLLILAVISVINLFSYQFAHRLYEIRRAMTISERNEALARIARLTPEQVALIGQTGDAAIEYIIGLEPDGEPTALPMEIRTQWGNVPVSFLREFIDKSNGNLTPAVRTWGEGSREREWARALVRLFASLAWVEADRKIQNESAHWLNRAAAERLLAQLQ